MTFAAKPDWLIAGIGFRPHPSGMRQATTNDVDLQRFQSRKCFLPNRRPNHMYCKPSFTCSPTIREKTKSKLPLRPGSRFFSAPEPISRILFKLCSATSDLLLIRLLQQATRGSVGACRAQRSRRLFMNSSRSSPLKRRARSICSPAVGQTASCVHDAVAGMLTN